MSAAKALLPRLLPLTLLTFGLAGCGPDKNEFAPPCPESSVARGLGDFTRYRAGGSDLTDMVMQGRLSRPSGKCEWGDKKALKVDVTANLRAEFSRGPAMPAAIIEVPVFLAVTDGKAVLDKTVFTVPVSFPANVDRVVLTSPDVRLALPTTVDKSPAAFTIVAGFQLTPEELAANRHRDAR